MSSKLLSLIRPLLTQLYNTKGFDRVGTSLQLIEARDDGYAKFKFTVDESMVNINGHLHGGFIGYIVDLTTSTALVARGENMGVSVDMNINYMRAAKLQQTVIVEALCKKAGSTLAFTEANLKNEEDKLLATATHTKYIQD